MSPAKHPHPRITAVVVDDAFNTAVLEEGRRLAVPLSWSRRLAAAPTAQRAGDEISADGRGVRRAAVDEDLGHGGFLHGSPAPGPSSR